MKKQPTFLEQAFVLIEDHYKHENPGSGMKIQDHKLNVKIMDLHLECMKIENDLQNESFKQKLIGDVVEVIQTELRPIKESMKRTETEICNLRSDLIGIKSEIKRISDENEKAHESFRNSIDKIMLRNKLWMIILRMVISIAAAYFLIKFAHDHWWTIKLIAVW